MAFGEVIYREVQANLPENIGELGGLVAVSGGADSVALLRGLLECAPGAIRAVGHFQHRLRGEEGDADARFVEELAHSLGLAYVTDSADVRALAEGAGANLEEIARRLRYEWLARAAAEVGAGWVATGHTLDDQAETILHRLIRGTGIQGLRGIAASRQLSEGVWLVRPMLTLSRAEVLAYLQSIGQVHRADSSNADTRFTRNRIRHELLPLLSSFNPQIASVLAHLAQQAAEVHAEQESTSNELLTQAELPRAGLVCVLDCEMLAKAGERRVRGMLRTLWQRERWPVSGMSFDHWERAADVALNQSPAIDLPGGIHVRRRNNVLQVGPSETSRPTVPGK
jgi:tRNA(Ile)-lysidine synthase